MRLAERFKVRAEDGSEYMVECWEEEIATPTDGTTVPGLKQYQLANGEAINPIDDRTFQVVIGGKIVKRVTEADET